MAQIVVRKFTCDRCKKPYNETETDAASDKKADAAPKVIFVLESHIANEKAATMPESVKFEDLCPKCQKRVLDLVGQIRLDSEAAGDDKSKPEAQTGDPAPATAPASSEPAVKVDKKPEKTDNKDKGTRAGGSAEPTTH